MGKTLDLDRILESQRAFVAAREWERFHTPKNLVMALAGEAAELMELFRWLTPEESARIMDEPGRATAVRHELADVLFFVLRLSDKLGIDLAAAIAEKMEENARRYPIDKARGNAKKYDEL